MSVSDLGEVQGMVRRGFVNSFVKAKHVLDGIHDGRFAVLEAIEVNLLQIFFDRLELDDRVFALAVVISAKPQHDVGRGPRELLPHQLLARYFSNVRRLLCLHRRDLRKQE
jgi:hypothetical protein